MFLPRYASMLKTIVLPVLFFAVSSGAVYKMWDQHRLDEEQRMTLETEITAEQIRLRLESWVDDRTAIVKHLADVLKRGGLDSSDQFTGEALHFLDLYPGFLAMNYVNQAGVIEIVVPHARNRAAEDQSLFDHPDPDVRTSFTRARDTNRLTRSTTVELLQGFRGIATYAPVMPDSLSPPTGYVNGVFRIDRLVDSCLSEETLREHFHFTMTESDGTVAYSSSDDMDSPYCATSVIRIVDRPWTLQLSPLDTRFATTATPDLFLMLSGLLMSMILALLLHTTMKRHAELAESKANYKLLVDNQKDLIVKLDDELRVMFVSPSYCKTFSVAAGDIMGRPLAEVTPTDEREMVLDAVRSTIESRDTTHHEQWIPTQDGTRWLAWNNSAVFNASGEPEAVIMVGRDITARRNLEEQLIQSQKMQAVGQLAGGIAHDFNNILQSISGCLELAMLDTDSESQPYRDMDQARNSASRAAALTRQLLAFSRRQVLKPQDIDLNTVVRDMLELLLRSVGRNVDLSYDFAEDTALIHADETQIQQILLNLCVNARDAINEDGRVHIVVDHATLGEQYCAEHAWARPGHYVRLEITDNGCGMDAKTLENVFEPFFTTKKLTGGTGLGLATVYGIVKQHNGLLDVESAPGEGTKFRIYFERTGRAPAPLAPLPKSDVRGGRETVLLAEDDDDVRNYTVRSLESAGYRVLASVDGGDALSMYERHRDEIDILLLDVVMPNVGGREVHDRVRETDPDIPVLFCSGFDSETIHSRFILDEGLELLSKPFDREQLLQRVRMLLDAYSLEK